MRVLLSVFGAILALLLIWFVWPAQIDPAYWDEPEPPALTGVLEPRGRLADAVPIAEGLITNSEDVAIGPNGAIYASQHSGAVVRITGSEGNWQVETVAHPTNLPALGLIWDHEGRLILAASDGIYRIDVETGAHETLATEAGGRPFGFADDLDIGPDGTIYFSEASWKWANQPDIPTYLFDLAENRPYGALIALDPDTGETDILIDDIYFANGVAVAADGRSVFVLETFRYRLSRYWLEGPQAGTVEIVADNLPGSPDGVLGDGEGRLYIAMNTQRVPLVAYLHRNPFITRMLTKLPHWVWAQAGQPTAFVLVMDEEGNYLDSYHDPDGRFGFLANAVPDANGDIWLGSLTEGLVGRYTPPTE